MKLSLQWLKDYVDTDKDVNEIADILTNAGLEVEELGKFSSLKSDLNGVVVGKVLSVAQHPNADKLKVTKVDVGAEEPLDIVCGAPNVAEGQMVPIATVGTQLEFEDGRKTKIKPTKVRGEVSKGMICAEDELGIGTNHDGIMVLSADSVIGSPFRDQLDVYTDDIIEVGLTPNRVDAACHEGAARDIATVLSKELKSSQYGDLEVATSNESYSIQIDSPDKCPRYSALVIKGIEVKDSPEWLQNRLKVIGIQPKNNIVDITNYVMHDIGHPLHAFDLSEIAGNQIVVRDAKKGEVFTTLDEKERTLTGDELMICNANEPMAIAGVLGGLKSGINTNTKDILIESAYFNPSTVRKSAKHHQIHTDASFRFERGVDPNNTIRALKLAAKLVTETAGGTVDKAALDACPKPIANQEFEFTYAYLKKLSGLDLDAALVKKHLTALGIQIISESAETLHLSIPTNKPDVTRPCDVVEEIMRIEGYNSVPFEKEMKSSLPSNTHGKSEKIKNRIVQTLNGLGFHQMKSSPLKNKANDSDVEIANPLSQESNALRDSLLVSGLPVLAYNANRQQKNLKFFETGKEYTISSESVVQITKLVLWAMGQQVSEDTWYQKARETDLYSLAGVASQLWQVLGLSEVTSSPLQDDETLEYGLTFEWNGQMLGKVGLVNQDLLSANDLKSSVFAIDLDLAKLMEASNFGEVKFKPLSKFPFVTRDVSFLLSNNIKYAQVEHCIRALKLKMLTEITCFDVYKGKNESDLVSYAIRLKFENPDKTLKDKQVDYFMGEIIKGLESLGCEIRK